MMNRRELLSAAGLLALPLSSFADNYPDKTINLITPLAPGDAADRAARLMGQELSKLLDVTVVVTNKPGAGGSLGAQTVIRSPKDGYSVLFSQNSPLTIRRIIDPATADYDPLKDLTPLALTTRSPSVLVVRSDAPYKTFKEMLQYGAKNNKVFNIGNAGPGSIGDVSVQLLNATNKNSLTSVNYKGASPAITDLLGGQIDGVILALGAVSPHIKSGKLRGLAISSAFPEFPDIPTLGSLGLKDDILGVWFGFLMPAGVPTDVVTKFTAALEKTVKDPAIASQLLPFGITQEWNPAEKLAEEISREYKNVSSSIKSKS